MKKRALPVDTTPELIYLADVCTLLSCGMTKARELHKAGEFESIGNRASLRIVRSSVTAYIERVKRPSKFATPSPVGERETLIPRGKPIMNKKQKARSSSQKGVRTKVHLTPTGKRLLDR